MVTMCGGHRPENIFHQVLTELGEELAEECKSEGDIHHLDFRVGHLQ